MAFYCFILIFCGFVCWSVYIFVCMYMYTTVQYLEYIDHDCLFNRVYLIYLIIITYSSITTILYSHYNPYHHYYTTTLTTTTINTTTITITTTTTTNSLHYTYYTTSTTPLDAAAEWQLRDPAALLEAALRDPVEPE